MKKSVFSHLRSSALLRVFAALALVVLTVSSVAAGVCSNCSTKSSEVTQEDNCSMSAAGEEIVEQSDACCCWRSVEKAEANKKSEPTCCSASVRKETTPDTRFSAQSTTTLDNSSVAGARAIEPMAPDERMADAVKLRQALQTAEPTNTDSSNCEYTGSCPFQVRTGARSTSQLPSRSIEQERQENATLMIQTSSAFSASVRLTRRLNGTTSILPREPSTLSGIGSQLLIC